MGKPITHLHVPMIDAEDVIRHLAKKEKHWKAGRSAHALTNLWFNSEGLPKSVRSIFVSHPVFQSAELVDAFLEREVDLRTPGRHSQADILAIIALKDRLAIVAVEGKAGEPFGKEYVHEWLDGSGEKDVRLTALCDLLALSVEDARPLRYQLLHRAASAIFEAKRYRSKLAVMLVQSFARDNASFEDFAKFMRAVGIKREIEREQLLGPVELRDVSFYAAWVDEKVPEFDTKLSYLDDLRRYADRGSKWCDHLRRWCDKRQFRRSNK